MFKRIFIIFMLYAGMGQASAPQRFFGSAAQNVTNFATKHPWWTAYASIGVLTGAAMIGAHVFHTNDLRELQRLKEKLSDRSLVNRDINCSLYSSAGYGARVSEAIKNYNNNKSFLNLGQVESAVNDAISEIKKKNEVETSYKSAVIIPYLLFGAIGAAASWFWGSK